MVPLFESTLRSLGRERIPTLAEVKDFVNTFDINQDGEIDVEEMKAVFKKVLSKAQNSWFKFYFIKKSKEGFQYRQKLVFVDCPSREVFAAFKNLNKLAD